MKCPYCQNACETGITESRIGGDLIKTQQIITYWYPEEEKEQWMMFRDHVKTMNRKTTGYYCSHCRKVFAEYDIYPLNKK
ncbi:MAG: PF20097 family protein [Erysipelotrichaceae bacterium]|nr:PF20097 family protein [Erysipelotrichaceae bacterium]